MRGVQQNDIPAAFTEKKEVLQAIYAVYDAWAGGFPLACGRGCASCCTRSVTMTTLEGEAILEHARERGQGQWLRAKLALAAPGQKRAGMTLNQFAWLCLSRQETDEELQEDWDLAPCVFLEEAICTVYPVRPFGCRSFCSLTRCGTGGSAEITPLHLAVNTVFTQIVEHLSSDGGCWGNMTDILHSLVRSAGSCKESPLLPARPVPGFLLADQEAAVVRDLLQQLSGRFSAGVIAGDLIDKFLPI